MKTRKGPLPDLREQQFNAVVAEHPYNAVRMARRVGGDLAAAEDVAQEAFIRAFRGRDRFRAEAQSSTCAAPPATKFVAGGR